MTSLLIDTFTTTGLLQLHDEDDSVFANECLAALLGCQGDSQTTNTATSSNTIFADDMARFLVEEIAELSHSNMQLDQKLAQTLTSAHRSSSKGPSPIQKVLSASELVEETTNKWPILASKATSLEPIPTSIIASSALSIGSSNDQSGDHRENNIVSHLTSQSLKPLVTLATLPQIAHTLVNIDNSNSRNNSQSKGNHLTSAVEIAALGQRVSNLHNSSLLATSVSKSLEKETTALARHCCSLLQNGPNSSLLQTVTALQRLLSTSNNSSTLPALFLRLRHNNIATELDSLAPLRDSGLTELYGKRVLEVLREQGFHTVATFHSLFTTANTHTDNNKSHINTTNHSLLIHSFVQGLIKLVMPRLVGLESSESSETTEGPSLPHQLIPQLLYCAQSLARPGADYTSVLFDQLPTQPLLDALHRQKNIQRSLNH